MPPLKDGPHTHLDKRQEKERDVNLIYLTNNVKKYAGPNQKTKEILIKLYAFLTVQCEIRLFSSATSPLC